MKNKELREQLIIGKKQDLITVKALDEFILIANKIYINIEKREDREDKISFALMNCYQYWRGYEPEKNAIDYITQIIKNNEK